MSRKAKAVSTTLPMLPGELDTNQLAALSGYLNARNEFYAYVGLSQYVWRWPPTRATQADTLADFRGDYHAINRATAWYRTMGRHKAFERAVTGQ